MPKVILVVTDGDSTDTAKLNSELETLKAAGVTFFAVGVGNKIQQEELEKIATDKDSHYSVRNYDLEFKIFFGIFTKLDSVFENVRAKHILVEFEICDHHFGPRSNPCQKSITRFLGCIFSAHDSGQGLMFFI